MVKSSGVFPEDFDMLRVFIFSFFFILVANFVKASDLPSVLASQAIYSIDDRHFVDNFSKPKISELSQSVALIVNKEMVTKKFLSSLISAKHLYDQDGTNICRDELFANHFSVNSCTGFLISDDLLVSAGHCFMSQNDCANKNIVFNVRASNESINGYKVSSSSVYECKEILQSVFDSDGIQDYSVIRLKKKVVGRKPLKIRKNGKIHKSDKVFMLGHPMGMALVKTGDAFVNDDSLEHSFKATLDSFEGNSGSPVFNAKTFEVEGILVRGEEDFLKDPTLECYRYQTYNELSGSSIKGEGVSRISDINDFLQNN